MMAISLFIMIVNEFELPETNKLTQLTKILVNSRVWPVFCVATSIICFYAVSFILFVIVMSIVDKLNITSEYRILFLPLLPIISFYLTRFFVTALYPAKGKKP
jgi:hypothetical protein